MAIPKKQLKITKLFRKGVTKEPENCDEFQEEIQQLEQKLRERQNELFQLQRNNYRHRASPHTKRLSKAEDTSFVRPQRLVLQASVDKLRHDFEVLSMLSGMEVQSYTAQDSCSVVFHMQHNSQHELKHGLRIDMTKDVNEVSASSLPLGFNLGAVLEDFDNVMKPDCLGAVRKALVAYYDRLEQYQKLKALVNMEAELFKTLDGSHMEVTLRVQSDRGEDEEPFQVSLLLDYRVYDMRPKGCAVRDGELPEGTAEALREQCAVFKRKPLHQAFRQAFVDGAGRYKLVRQIGHDTPRPRRRARPTPRAPDYDDTFRPEECSDASDEDDPRRC